MKLIDLNRDGGIGANSLYLQIGNFHVLIDCGLHPKKVGRAATPDFSPLRGVKLDLIIITHCHLDHIGSVPLILREQPEAAVVMSPPSQILIGRMLHNSANVMLRQKEEEAIPDYPLFTHEEIDRQAKRFTPLQLGRAKVLKKGKQELAVILHLAGHVAGAVGVELVHEGRHIFATGDVLFEPQRTLPGARFPAGHFDTVIVETTRGTTERPAGKERVHEVSRLIDTINSTIKGGGSILIPVFALGRMQEIVSILHDAAKFGRLLEMPIFASGLGVDLCDYFDEISRKTNLAQFARSMLKELKVKKLPKNLVPGRPPPERGLYLISSGMMVENTPSYVLASGLIGHAKNTVAFVGYSDPETPGGKLLAAKPGESFLFDKVNVRAPVKARIERFEMSGHADREELLDFALQATPRSVVLTHGDPPARAWFQQQLSQRAPQTQVFDPVPLQPYEV